MKKTREGNETNKTEWSTRANACIYALVLCCVWVCKRVNVCVCKRAKRFSRVSGL